MVQRTVLVADDESPVRLLCRVNLEADGYRVLEAVDGNAALDQARGELPDVIVLDVMMPGLDGWSVAEQLLADPRTNGIPIVFLSARADTTDRTRGIELGGIDYITKPFDPTKLSETLHDVIARAERGESDELRRTHLAELRRLVDT